MQHNPEEQEREFRDFITKLLRAQKYEFLKENELFSRNTLHSTLKELCDIIADVVGAQSCTIHLKLYDPSMSTDRSVADDLLSKKLAKHIETVASNWNMKDKDKEVLSIFYGEILTKTLTFPYWRYPKGVAQLVAWNEGGPWSKANLPIGDRRVPLDSGITADIFQDNFAKIRDPYSIRSSRNLRKLGRADHLVWKNAEWDQSFKNFYGTPIRIHPGGEVVGILKVENKEDEDVKKAIGDLMDKGFAAIRDRADDFTIFEESLLQLSTTRSISLLALAYLNQDLNWAYDVELASPSRLSTLGDLFFTPYPRSDNSSMGYGNHEAQWNNLASCVKQHPVPQVMTGKSAEEYILRSMLAPSSEKGAADIKSVYRQVKLFLRDITEIVTKCDYDCPSVKRQLEGHTFQPRTLGTSPIPPLTISNIKGWNDNLENDQRLPHFYYQLRVNGKVSGEEQSIVLYVCIPPDQNLINDQPRLSGILGKCETETHKVALAYQALSKMACGGSPFSDADLKMLEPLVPTMNGEMIVFRDRDGGILHTHSVIDLLVDRWAARIEALNHCAQVQDFSPEDTKKLSWAALEVGKVVEREISYRANRSDDAIPLTAMEFYRIPISDLCFVDDLRERRAAAKQVKIHIDHHLQTTLHTMHLQDAVRYTSRLKSQRSHLSRLGERHEGFVRGNLAIWFYLLSLTKDVLAADRKNRTDFLGYLCRFRESVDQLVEHYPPNPYALPLPFGPAAEFFTNHCDRLIGDTQFLSPPFPPPTGALPFGSIPQLQKRVVRNLKNEGFLKRDPLSLTDSNEKERTKLLEDLVFRQYDSYAISATSLLCQLLNLDRSQWRQEATEQRHEPHEFYQFYRKCFDLKQLLSVSAREIEDTPKFNQLAAIFSKPIEETAWFELERYIELNDTNAFMKLLVDESQPSNDKDKPKAREQSSLYLNTKGIYKRIRNLNHVLRQQRSVADLDWDLRRFDLLGCRLNCLYKNQTFAVYEQLWNSGDPFWGMVTATPSKESGADSANTSTPITTSRWVKGKKFFNTRPRGRQRWLCLRTNFFEGDYYALQIAALLDPSAIHEGFWDRNGYNLRRLQFIMGKLFAHLDSEDAARYRSLARMRHHLRWEYAEWYKVAASINRTKSVPPDADVNVMLGFGSFLGEAAVDYLIELIQGYRECVEDHSADQMRDNALINIAAKYNQLREPLLSLLRYGQKYTDALLASFTARDEDSQPFRFEDDAILCIDKFKVSAANLYGRLLQLGEGPPRQHLWEMERDHYDKLFHQDQSGKWYIASASPIMFISPDCGEQTIGKIERIGCIPETSHNSRELLGICEVLTKLRREQKGYLFFRGNPEGGPGLSLRDKENVLHRIQNYVLLYQPGDEDTLSTYQGLNNSKADVAEELKDRETGTAQAEGRNVKGDGHCGGWTSYGMFYYLRSLVPVEIQMRTMLADTLSEQYHDSVYKGAPPQGTEFPRRQMERVARTLDDVDKEMEIDFEDFIDARTALERAHGPKNK